METKKVNACAFFVFDEAGNLTGGGIAEFTRLKDRVATQIRTFKKEAAKRMYNTRPSYGFTIVDDFTGGRLKLLTSVMEDGIPYSAVTALVDTLRDIYKLPLVVDGVEVRGMFVKPNPAKS